jgi:hypothetical protein
MSATGVMAPLNEWFCLKKDKENFTIIPERDQAFLFGKAMWRDQIEKHLKMSLILKEPVRLVWWGDFGIGKTQRLQYMRHVIEQDGLSFYPVSVTCRDLTTKSGFEALHYDLVNNIGFPIVRKMVADYLKQPPSVAIPFAQLSPVIDVATAMERVGDSNDQLAATAWKYITGTKLEKGERPLANVTRDRLDSSVEFASVLKCLAWVIKVATGQQLLFLVDQMETLGNVTNRDFESAWVETLRAVLDIRDIGVVCTIGGMRMELIPAIMLRPEILSRFKQDNYLRLAQYEPETAEDFLKELLKEWIDPILRDQSVQAHDLDKIPGYDPATFPFTQPAFESFCQYLTGDPRDAKPREILERMNKVAAQACLQGVRLINKTELQRQGISA